MMDHILELDWCATSADTRPYLVSKKALDNCCIEKILRNKFHDPLLSSDEEENAPNNIDWDTVFKSRNTDKTNQKHVPGLHPLPSYPKESMITAVQHFHCLKVLSEKSPHVLPDHTFRKPIPPDYRIYESLKELYEKEQKEFINWAKSLWPTSHCSQVLNRDPVIETTYEKEFRLRAKRLTGYPTSYDMAAQIPLECSKKLEYNATKLETLISVNMSELPVAKIPDLLEYTSIMDQCVIPEPCYKHTYQFVLPNEDSVSMLPIIEIHRELSQFAVENGVKLIASENALKCLLSVNRHWTIPITVCPAITADGVGCNVVVLDSEFSLHKEPALMRTYKAYRRLLLNTLIPSSEYKKVTQNNKKNSKVIKPSKNNVQSSSKVMMDDDTELSSDDEPSLVIVEGDDYNTNDSNMKESKRPKSPEKQKMDEVKDGEAKSIDEDTNLIINDITIAESVDTIGVYSCTCSNTQMLAPSARSYSKWRFVNSSAVDDIDLIIHFSHKATTEKCEELIMEPIPEYQLDVGASEQLPDNVLCTTLAQMLRDNAKLLTVRLDGSNGEIVRLDTSSSKELNAHSDNSQKILNIIHTTLNELQGLLPGNYLLKHEPSHGANALLYVSRPEGTFKLDFDLNILVEPDEAKVVDSPPTITPVLLPFHKYRRILPCAFTPHSQQVSKKESKKPPPPKPKPAKWQKKKNKKKAKKKFQGEEI